MGSSPRFLHQELSTSSVPCMFMPFSWRDVRHVTNTCKRCTRGRRQQQSPPCNMPPKNIGSFSIWSDHGLASVSASGWGNDRCFIPSTIFCQKENMSKWGVASSSTRPLSNPGIMQVGNIDYPVSLCGQLPTRNLVSCFSRCSVLVRSYGVFTSRILDARLLSAQPFVLFFEVRFRHRPGANLTRFIYICRPEQINSMSCVPFWGNFWHHFGSLLYTASRMS